MLYRRRCSQSCLGFFLSPRESTLRRYCLRTSNVSSPPPLYVLCVSETLSTRHYLHGWACVTHGDHSEKVSERSLTRLRREYATAPQHTQAQAQQDTNQRHHHANLPPPPLPETVLHTGELLHTRSTRSRLLHIPSSPSRARELTFSFSTCQLPPK